MAFPWTCLTPCLPSLGLQLIQGGQTYIMYVTQVSDCWLVNSLDCLAVSWSSKSGFLLLLWARYFPSVMSGEMVLWNLIYYRRRKAACTISFQCLCGSSTVFPLRDKRHFQMKPGEVEEIILGAHRQRGATLRFHTLSPSCYPLPSGMCRHSPSAPFTGCAGFARDSAVQLLLHGSVDEGFSCDWKPWKDSAFPTVLISQAETSDVQPMAWVQLLFYIQYNMWNGVGTCWG